MPKLMWIAGILLIAAGIALGLMVFVSTASVVAWGITLETASILLVGGLLSLGLGSVVDSLDRLRRSRTESVFAPELETAPAVIPEFGRRSAEAAAVSVAAAAAAKDEIAVSEPVKETIEALEQARQKIEQAFDPKPASAAEPVAVPEPVLEPADEERLEEPATAEETVDLIAEPEPEAEEAGEGQLYVVEERLIRGRPARILSDSTVEAETDEGWMRFENIEHLDEYLDAMAPAAQP